MSCPRCHKSFVRPWWRFVTDLLIKDDKKFGALQGGCPKCRAVLQQTLFEIHDKEQPNAVPKVQEAH